MLMKKNVPFIGWWQKKLWGNMMVYVVKHCLLCHFQCGIVKWMKCNVFFNTCFSASPDIIDNSKLITEECRKKVNGKHTICVFVVQTTGFIPGCTVPALRDRILSNTWSSEISLNVRHPDTNKSEPKYFYSW